MKKKNETKFVVIGETLDIETRLSDMIECLGVFNDATTAYGKAVMYLSEIANGIKGKSTITPRVELEGQTGFALYLKNEDGQMIYDALVLFYDEKEDSE